MTVAVVGGSGFIGSRLCRRFTFSQHDFLIVDKTMSISFPSETKICDIGQASDLATVLAPVAAIVNLAAEHRDDVTPKSLYDDVNVEGARNVCLAAEANNINTIVFTSTVAVYGFAPLGTDESGEFNPFNDYGRTKLEAEIIYRRWQAKDPVNRCLVIIRPTVVFGEANRGNVYNLLKQIASGKFLMIGPGTNVKSMAYVENIAAFIQHSLTFGPGVHIYNYVDKPDFDMNTLVSTVYLVLCQTPGSLRLPYSLGIFVGKCFDALASVTGKKFPVSAIRVKKFCSDTMFNTSVKNTGFIAPVKLKDALERTIRYEFVDDNAKKQVFFSE